MTDRNRDLIVTERGAFLSKRSERLLVKSGRTISEEIPFFRLRQVVVLGRGVSLSSDVLEECALNGVPLHFLKFNGEPYARLSAPDIHGTVRTRREQILAFNDERGTEFARAVVEGKIRNQINVLKYFAKHRREVDHALHESIYAETERMRDIASEMRDVKSAPIDDVRMALMNIEGRAAAVYWATVGKIAPKGAFSKRIHQGAEDLANSLINYGYGILYTQVWSAVALAGLDPFAGFLHVDRPGKPSMVLDLVEEFRQPVVDRVVLAALTKGSPFRVEKGRLTERTRRAFAERILERLSASERYGQKKRALRTILQMQARKAASFFRGEGPYKAFVAAW